MSWNHDAAVENRKIPTFLGQLYQATFCSNIVNSAITFLSANLNPVKKSSIRIINYSLYAKLPSCV